MRSDMPRGAIWEGFGPTLSDEEFAARVEAGDRNGAILGLGRPRLSRAWNAVRTRYPRLGAAGADVAVSEGVEELWRYCPKYDPVRGSVSRLLRSICLHRAYDAQYGPAGDALGHTEGTLESPAAAEMAAPGRSEFDRRELLRLALAWSQEWRSVLQEVFLADLGALLDGKKLSSFVLAERFDVGVRQIERNRKQIKSILRRHLDRRLRRESS